MTNNNLTQLPKSLQEYNSQVPTLKDLISSLDQLNHSAQNELSVVQKTETESSLPISDDAKFIAIRLKKLKSLISTPEFAEYLLSRNGVSSFDELSLDQINHEISCIYYAEVGQDQEYGDNWWFNCSVYSFELSVDA